MAHRAEQAGKILHHTRRFVGTIVLITMLPPTSISSCSALLNRRAVCPRRKCLPSRQLFERREVTLNPNLSISSIIHYCLSIDPHQKASAHTSSLQHQITLPDCSLLRPHRPSHCISCHSHTASHQTAHLPTPTAKTKPHRGGTDAQSAIFQISETLTCRCPPKPSTLRKKIDHCYSMSTKT